MSGADFSGAVALVTGGSRGIGAAESRTPGARGAFVYVNYHRRQDAAAAVLDDIRRAGGDGALAPASVAERGEVGGLCARGRKEKGRLDLLVNNAAVLHDRLLGTMSNPEWHDVVSFGQIPPDHPRALVEQSALRRPGRPGEVAEVVALLLSDATSFVHGQTVLVDGGLIHP